MSNIDVAPHPDDAVVRERFAAFVDDDLSRKLLHQSISELGLSGMATVVKGDINTAIGLYENKRSPKALLIDLSGIEPAVTRIQKLADLCDPGVSVIAIGDRNDVPLFRDLLLAGVSDYLVKPLSRSLIDKAMSRLLSAANVPFTPSTRKLGEVVSLVGSRGGIGASTIATNLAWGLSNKRHRRVALIDLNLAYGACGLLLDVKAESGLREALERPHRVDELFLERAMVPVGDRLSLLGCRETQDEPIKVDPDALARLIELVRKEFHFVVLDTPRSNPMLLDQSLQLSNTRIFIVDQTTLAIRDMLSMRASVIPPKEDKRNLVVLNRFGELGRNAIQPRQVEAALGMKIDAVIPFDPESVVTASNAGMPLMARRGHAARGIDSIADLLGGELPASKRRGRWLKFFRS